MDRSTRPAPMSGGRQADADTGSDAREPTSGGAERPSVIVVGAGFGGLAAAWYLALAGCPVTVFEARDRVGGRVYSLTDFAAGRIIEGGAELIGSNHPCWLFLARRFGLGLNVVTTDDLFTAQGLEAPLFLDGHRLSPAEIEQVDRETSQAEQDMNADAREIDAYRPWTAPRAREWDARSLEAWIAALEISPLGKAALAASFANNNGVPCEDQSYLANLALVKGGGGERFWTDTELLRCASGNQALATHLAREITASGGTVHLDRAVTAIAIDAGGVTVDTGAGTARADHLVLAIPPSTWDQVDISPAIPPEMHVQMGVNIKYLTTVRSRFWLEAGLAATSATDTFGMSWEGTDNQTELPGQDVELSVFAGGETAARALDAPDPAAWFTPRLEQLYPAYSVNAVASRFMAWPREPWTRAGYSCPRPGQVCTVGPFLREPYRERLWFAGEHACLAFFGFMEGALQSGVIAARGICARARIPPPLALPPQVEGAL